LPNPSETLILFLMKPVLWFPFSCVFALIFSSCSNNDPTLASDPLGTGPFDARGNYREEWANDPTKWRKPSHRQQAPDVDFPVIARNEQPPANANPLAPQGSSRSSGRTTQLAKVEQTPRETSRTTTAAPKPVTAKPKPKPKPVLVKAKPKPVPKTTRYVVKKGDSLSAIDSRNGSSVSAIQRANRISGTLIHPGQSLVIPKR
jgi:LysM repeat protein